MLYNIAFTQYLKISLFYNMKRERGRKKEREREGGGKK